MFSSKSSIRSWIAEHLLEYLIVISIIATLAALVLPGMRDGRNPKGPFGENIPSAPPVEANRITHASGLSIVAPLNWDELDSSVGEMTAIRIAARGSPVRRLRSVISVMKIDPLGRDQLFGLNVRKFQGFTAYEKAMHVVRNDSFDDPALSSYWLIIERQSDWWWIGFSIADSLTELPPEINQYLETVRFPKVEASSQEAGQDVP